MQRVPKNGRTPELGAILTLGETVIKSHNKNLFVAPCYCALHDCCMPMTQMSLSDSSEPDFPVNEDCLGTSNAVGNCLICPLLALDPEAPKLPKR